MNRSLALNAALRVEARKLLVARVPVATALLLVLGVTAISAAVLLAVESGSSAVVAKLGPLAAQGGWLGYLSAATQVTAAGGFLGCGVVVSWMFGREFTDGTVAGLFALPVRRTDLAMAKLLAYLAWALVIAAVLPVVVLGAGLGSGFGSPSGEGLGALLRLAVLVPATALMAIPCAWVATLTSGPLGGIGATIVLVASSQILVLSGSGAWFPPAAPALWAMAPEAVDPAALWTAAWLPAVAIALTMATWQRLQLDRS